MKKLIMIADRDGISEKLRCLGFQYIATQTRDKDRYFVYEETNNLLKILSSEYSAMSVVRVDRLTF